jgi:hypothetical protein
MAVSGMNHFTILTDDVDATVNSTAIGSASWPASVPTFGFPGAYCTRARRRSCVVGGRPREQLKPGVIDHMAFTAAGLPATLAQLDARGSGVCMAAGRLRTWQVFFFDPNGARVELIFRRTTDLPRDGWARPIT